MRLLPQLALFLLLPLAAGVAQSVPPSNAPAGNPSDGSVLVNPTPQSPSIRILTPVAGQTLAANFVDLRFELVQPALSDEPNFLVQLDAADPISTTETSYTFTSLQPGVHSVRVTLVDANNLPVQGGAATVQFRVAPQQAPARANSTRSFRQPPAQGIDGLPPAAPIPAELRDDDDTGIPLAGSPLPLLSLIGFGLLIGGAAQAMRKH